MSENIIHLVAEISDGILTIERTDGQPINIKPCDEIMSDITGEPIAIVEYGDTGSVVRAVQCLINAHGNCGRLAEDGIFGELTQTALIIFQDKHNLTPNGVCDLKTLECLIRS